MNARVISILCILLLPPIGMASEAPANMLIVPGGHFVMGSNKHDELGLAQEYGSKKALFIDEHPEHSVYLAAFLIDKYEVSNKQYREFVEQTNYWLPMLWKTNGYHISHHALNDIEIPRLKRMASQIFQLDIDLSKIDKRTLLDAIYAKQNSYDNLPVAGVTWHNAKNYCRWTNKRLPSEAEWEKAARGTHTLEYPWGNEWDASRVNEGSGGGWETGVAPVGTYARGISPYGLYDMAGNVMEWVGDWYGPYSDGNNSNAAFGEKFKVVRGGSWGGFGHYNISLFFRAAGRFYFKPDAVFDDLGFRCAKSTAD